MYFHFQKNNIMYFPQQQKIDFTMYNCCICKKLAYIFTANYIIVTEEWTWVQDVRVFETRVSAFNFCLL